MSSAEKMSVKEARETALKCEGMHEYKGGCPICWVEGKDCPKMCCAFCGLYEDCRGYLCDYLLKRDVVSDFM